MSADAWQAMQPRYGVETGGVGFGGDRFLGPPGGRNGVAARQGIEFDYVHATLQIDDWTFRDVAVRYKGNGSYLRATRAGSDKISLKVDLNKYVEGPEAGRADHHQLPEQHHGRRLDERGARLPAVSRRGRARAAHDLRAGLPHRRRPAREALPRPLLDLRERGRELRRGAVRHAGRAPSSSHPRRSCSPTGARTGRSTTSRTIPRPT